MAAGAYSSIFIATPVLADLKEREPADAGAGQARGGPAGRRGEAAGRARRGPGGRGRRAASPRRTPGRARPPAATPSRGHRRPAPAAQAASRRKKRPAVRSAEAAAVALRPCRRSCPRYLAARVRDVPDYPQPGVVFKDITPLLADHVGLRRRRSTRSWPAMDAARRRQGRRASRPAASSSAAAVAYRFGAGFVPVRKAGKLPRATHAQAYDLEYGVGRPSRCTPTRSPRATGCWWSTTCSPPAAPRRRRCQLVRRTRGRRRRPGRADRADASCAAGTGCPGSTCSPCSPSERAP